MREKERQEMESRGLVDRQDVKKKLQDAITFVGSCTDMCPIFERVRRTYENNVKQLEKDPQTGKVTSQYAVKAFSRPAAGQPPPLPSDVRPPHILVKTLQYLSEKILPQLPASHSFLWDRTRSIRQDFTYQNYSGPEAIECNEIIARIHIICLHVMAGHDQEYSKQQEIEQLTKTLQTLSEFYNDNRKRGLPDSPNEPEMRAFQLLCHLKDPDVEFQVQQLPIHVFKDARIQRALELRNLVQQNRILEKGHIYTENAANIFALFFEKLATDGSTPPLYLCLLESSFNDIRLASLNAMSRAYHSRGKPYFIDRLTSMLGFDSEQEGLEFCQYYDLTVVDDASGKKCVDLVSYNQSTVNNKQPKQQPFSLLVDRRVGAGYNQLVVPSRIDSASTTPAASGGIGTGFGGFSARSNSSFGNSINGVAKPVFGSGIPSPGQTPNIFAANKEATLFGGTKSSIPSMPSAPPATKAQTWANIASGAVPATTEPTPAVKQEQSALQTQPFSLSGGRGIGLAKPQSVGIPLTASTASSGTTPNSMFGSSKPFSFGGDTIKATSTSLLPNKTPQPSSNVFTNPFASNASADKKQAPDSASTVSPLGQTPASTPGPKPALPTEPVALPPPPKPVYTDSMVKKQIDRMLRSAVSGEISSNILPSQWKSITQARQERKALIDSVSEDIYKKCISDLLYRQSANALAEHLFSRRLRRDAIRLISAAGQRAKERADRKRKILEEYRIVSQTLGRSDLRRSSSNGSLRSRPTSSSSHVSEKEQIKAMKRARVSASNEWSPYALKPLLIPSVEEAFRRQSQFDRTVSLAIFVPDWEKTEGTWTRSKLSLVWDGQQTSTYCNKVENNSTQINLMALESDPATFSRIGMLIFECGVDLSIEPQAFEAVISSLVPRSEFLISLLIVNWDGRSQSDVYEHLNITRYESLLDNITFCSLTSSSIGKDISVNFSVGLERLSQSFTATLSTLGLQLRKQQAANNQRRLALKAAKEEQERRLALEKQKQDKWNRLSSLNSLHVYTESPSPPTAPPQPKRKRSFNDSGSLATSPATKSARNPSAIHSTPVQLPKALAELKDLVSSVLTRTPQSM
ncbi:Sac3p [Sugiyamaella lignohabitans]|uniref:Nuclear mRNA export factor n=1 Tax=Sugiyamaella lignohabitans TaxID=796027 RepID=A0A167DR67_9ASCO|nr:Sac3p [Sugiyamaella lignohabitans]ANB13195.1 Sac3p [Sugiyamaella lignohabitans]